VKAVHLKNGSPIFLKNQKFRNGTIEYDIELGAGFPGVTFRASEDRKYGENFYLRYFGSTSPMARTTLQYATIIDGLSMWDLTDEYQAAATLRIPGWNHVRLVISGRQMKAYVNDMTRPCLVVPELEGSLEEGAILFGGGRIMLANLVLKPDVIDGLNPEPGLQLTSNDSRYLRHWEVTGPMEFAYGQEVVHGYPFIGNRAVESQLPDSTATWVPVSAGAREVVNLSRNFGMAANNGRRLAWLRTTITSEHEQERLLHLGFSDEIWLFVNGQIVYVDKNHFGSPGQKFPSGRCTIENASVRLPLRQGKNEVLIALANYFYGWGVIARLDDTSGLILNTGTEK
jgi:hypothetical protein